MTLETCEANSVAASSSRRPQPFLRADGSTYIAPDVRLVGDLQHLFPAKTRYPNKSVAFEGAEDRPIGRRSESVRDFFYAQLDLFPMA